LKTKIGGYFLAVGSIIKPAQCEHLDCVNNYFQIAKVCLNECMANYLEEERKNVMFLSTVLPKGGHRACEQNGKG